jgi:hypothetical protein
MTAPRSNGQRATDGRTPSERAREATITEAVADICQRRALIEQVKGVLMCVYDIDAGTAFELLRERSMDTNVKLRDLAGQLMADFCRLIADGSALSRSEVDRLLHSAHERV